MYVASAATTLKLHDFATGEMVHNYQPGTNPDGSIRSVTWSKDGQWLCVVPFAGNVEVVGVRDRLKLLRTIEAVKYPTSACFQHSTKKSLAIGSRGGMTVVYDIKSKATRKVLRGPRDEVTHVRFTAQDSHLVAASKDGAVFVYNCVTNGNPRQLSVPKSKTLTCLVTHSSKKNLVMGGSAEGTVVVWDLNVSRSKFQTMAHQAAVNCVAFSPNRVELISTAGQDRQCYFFDTADGKQIANLSLPNCATSMDFTPDAKHFLLGHQKGYVSIYDLRNFQKPLRTFQAHDRAVKNLVCQPLCEQNATVDSDISIESTPVRRLSEKKAAPRFSDLFSVSFCSPDVDNNRTPEVAAGSPSIFNVDSPMNYSTNSDRLFSQASPAGDVGRLSVGEQETKVLEVEKLRLPLSSTPKTATSVVQSTSTQTDTFGASALADFKDELRADIAELRSTVETKSLETVFELRSIMCRSEFYIIKNLMKLMDSVENIETNIICLAEENMQMRQRLDVLEDQLKNMHLI